MLRPAMLKSLRDNSVRNVALLAFCQALSMTCLSLLITISALVGSLLSPDPSLATLPLSLQFLGVLVTTVPASLLMQHWGRRAGFSLGAVLGIVGGLVCTFAVFAADFLLLCVGSTLLGGFSAFSMYYRFAAADTASNAFKSRAISLVLAGGVLAAVAGPELAKQTRELFAPVAFAGGYAAIAAVCLLSLVVLQFIRIPRPPARVRGDSGRPLSVIARQPRFVVAVVCGMVAYGTMNLVMVSTPLAMIACDHPFETAAFVIQLHVLGMYLPSFFTGSLIARFGLPPVLLAGTLLLLACVAVALTGIEVLNFAAGLVLLGLGWNLLYVGGSTLLTETHRPEEKAKVQAANEFLVFGTVTLTAFTSGALHEGLGWEWLNLVTVPAILAALVSVLWLLRVERRPELAAS